MDDTIRVDCDYCGGDGWVENFMMGELFGGHPPAYLEEELCPECGGTGIIVLPIESELAQQLIHDYEREKNQKWRP